jgi:hypothetical protein
MITINDTIEIETSKNKKQYVYVYDYIYKEGDGYRIESVIYVEDTEDELLKSIREKNQEWLSKYNALSPEDKRKVDTLMRKRNKEKLLLK